MSRDRSPAGLGAASLSITRGSIARRPTLTDDTYYASSRSLINQQIYPSEWINICALSLTLCFSVTPIRETLARLESEALVTKRPLAGYMATPLLTAAQVS